jgi:hypothetical protein
MSRQVDHNKTSLTDLQDYIRRAVVGVTDDTRQYVDTALVGVQDKLQDKLYDQKVIADQRAKQFEDRVTQTASDVTVKLKAHKKQTTGRIKAIQTAISSQGAQSERIVAQLHVLGEGQATQVARLDALLARPSDHETLATQLMGLREDMAAIHASVGFLRQDMRDMAERQELSAAAAATKRQKTDAEPPVTATPQELASVMQSFQLATAQLQEEIRALQRSRLHQPSVQDPACPVLAPCMSSLMSSSSSAVCSSSSASFSFSSSFSSSSSSSSSSSAPCASASAFASASSSSNAASTHASFASAVSSLLSNPGAAPVIDSAPAAPATDSAAAAAAAPATDSAPATPSKKQAKHKPKKRKRNW